jgi:D-beta-D-heptose 7-phosphate kinase/D-beta-D-heptose 1-phosphate adenosyltransferase
MTDRTSPLDRFTSFEGVTVVVIGDVMLDAYLQGHVSRISPEAPVPVVKHARDRFTAGGAANVALNAVALGASARLIGVVGDDQAADQLRAIAEQAGVSCRLLGLKGGETTTKTRVLAGAHQVVRIDREGSNALSAEDEAALIALFEQALDQADAVIVSDYAKGCLPDAVLAAVFDRARKVGVPVFVDPKRPDFSAYRGAAYIKPNRSELAGATGRRCDDDAAVGEAARQVLDQTGANLLVTRSEQGMAFYGVDGEAILLETEAAEVFDVSGAGDTVMAAFALGVASGLPVVRAMRLANTAASIVVSKAGTAVVSAAELRTVLNHQDQRDDHRDGLILSRADARAVRGAWRDQGLSVGFTNGCFDLLHPGHVALLREAASHCDRLIVGLNSDASVRRLKGETRPIQSEGARAEVMAAIRHVDAVVLFEEDTPYELIAALEPDVLVKGADYQEHQIVGADLVRAKGGIIVRVELRAGHSTTGLVDRSRTPSA